MIQRLWGPLWLKQEDQLEDSCPWAKIERKLQNKMNPAGWSQYLAHSLARSKCSINFPSPESMSGMTDSSLCNKGEEEIQLFPLLGVWGP